jgi:hypothetical protein
VPAAQQKRSAERKWQLEVVRLTVSWQGIESPLRLQLAPGQAKRPALQIKQRGHWRGPTPTAQPHKTDSYISLETYSFSGTTELNSIALNRVQILQ